MTFRPRSQRLHPGATTSKHQSLRRRSAGQLKRYASSTPKPVNASVLFNAVNHSVVRRQGNSTRVVPAPMLAGSTQLQSLPGVRLLLVDDSDINLEIGTHLLSREGASVTTASNGREALAILRQDPSEFDAVLMDVQMPEMDGLEATRAMRRESELSALPVIALTAGALAQEWMMDNPDCRVRFHDWWRAPRTMALVQATDRVASHASWMENFPWTRLPNVAMPAERKKMINLDLMRAMNPAAGPWPRSPAPRRRTPPPSRSACLHRCPRQGSCCFLLHARTSAPLRSRTVADAPAASSMSSVRSAWTNA